MRFVAVTLLMPVGALAAQQSLGATTGESSNRCASFADSLRASTAADKLPIARPRGEMTLLRTPRDAALGRVIRSSVLVSPDGNADTTTVDISGTTDSAYRRDFMRTIARTQFHPPIVTGCRVWGWYWIALSSEGHYRTASP